MSNVETYQLCHPELLSEETLYEILKNRCVAEASLENLTKDQLIEIFKRIAMPLPQRKYNDSQRLGKKMNNLRAKRGVDAACSNENIELLAMNHCLIPQPNSAAKDRLKPPVNDSQQATKKIRLSNSCLNGASSKTDTKRKNDISTSTESKKRQKITWP